VLESNSLFDFDGDGVLDQDDCVPDDPAVYPGSEDPVDASGVDNNCDGVDGVDQDQDGHASLDGEGLVVDCNDDNSAIYPGAVEICDQADNDCDGLTDDESSADAASWHPDADGDGAGDPAQSVVACVVPPGYVADSSDCDDRDASVLPGAVELCDGLDTDCDGALGSGLDGTPDEADGDEDGAVACLDCDDANPSRFPGAVELCDGLDNDCNELADFEEGEDDIDGDGAPSCSDCNDGDVANTPGAVELCDGQDNDCNGLADFEGGEDDLDGDGVAVCAGDCDDADSANWAGAIELCDGQDNDCNGLADADAAGEQDTDGDGALSCLDCDDSSAANRPGGVELCDGLDNDCDDGTFADALGEIDGDGDGSFSCADCNDADVANTPGASEVCDGQDNDCNGLADADGGELDADQDGVLTCGGDCDDADPANAPGNPEQCDGQDNDCDDDSFADAAGEVDDDGDGALSCVDCDDSDASKTPGAAELCDGEDNDCNGLADAEDGEEDGDGDGSRGCEGDCDDDDASVYEGAAELCDDLDNDCDGSLSDPEADDDGDGLSLCEGDCNNELATVGPGFVELCDGLDTNCDGLFPSQEADADNDEFMPCTGDCDDANSDVRPDAAELCDGLDTDCDPTTWADAEQEQDLDGDGDPSCADCDDNEPDMNSLDGDGDGFTTCGADGVPSTADDDCDDSSIGFYSYPGASDFHGDAIDQDCDGIDGIDNDGDGWPDNAAPSHPDLDCDPDDPSIHPDPLEEDVFDDGIDSNCDGVDGEDLDGDGYAGNAMEDPIDQQWDCDDTDPLVHPGTYDNYGDGVDSNCDSMDGIDEDLDGFAVNAPSDDQDCNDTDMEIFPAASDDWGDTVDSNCDGADGIDGDGDGWAENADPPDIDCNDGDILYNPGAADNWGDGDDTNCDGVDGLDQDGDGWAVNGVAPDLDCDDDPGSGGIDIHPQADDPWGDGDDTNCDGADGLDQDGDGWAENAPGLDWDCEDGIETIYPGAPDSPGDGVNQDCDDCSGEFLFNDSGLALVDSNGNPLMRGDGIDVDCDGYALNGPGFSLDCNDADETIHPGAGDPWGDDVNSNCDGMDGVDLDGDGWAGNAPGENQDCNDLVSTSYPTAPDSAGDGVDSDCDNCPLFGTYLVDDEGNQIVDSNFNLLTPGDGVDVDCDGYAQNGPGFFQDCDDENAAVYPGSTEVWESAAQDLDTNCDGDLYTSLGTAEYLFHGQDGSEHAGNSVSSAGDVDGDGLDDLLVGAYYADGVDPSGNDGFRPGKVYLILGSSLGTSSTINLSLADYSFGGEASGDQAGVSVSSAGDVDGDGLDDILVGARYNDDGGGVVSIYDGAGKAYLILGSSLGSAPTINLSLADYSFVGENIHDYAGTSVASAGDVDGDGLDDLLVGAPGNDDGGGSDDLSWDGAGKAYLILGSSLGTSPVIDLSLADYSFVGEDSWNFAGTSVSSAGDVDDDGLDDILVAAIGNADGGSSGGKVYVILGGSLGAPSTIDLSLADYSLVAEGADDHAGQSVSTAGDVNGDGLEDILVGAYGNDDGGLNAGVTYLILGSSLGVSSINLSSADYTFVGESTYDYSGRSVSSAGDVDGDGLGDLFVGAGQNSKVYLLLGSSLGASPVIELSLADHSFLGDPYGGAGTSLASAGDVNGDGLDDLLVGAPGNDWFMENTGSAYLLLSPFATPDYAGLWTLSSSTSYSCGLGLVSAQLDHLVIDHVAPYATVSGSPELTMDARSPQPGLLQGGFTSTDVFLVERTESLDSGACTATWELDGSYTDSGCDSSQCIDATYSVTFAGACGDCVDQSWAVVGER